MIMIQSPPGDLIDKQPLLADRRPDGAPENVLLRDHARRNRLVLDVKFNESGL